MNSGMTHCARALLGGLGTLAGLASPAVGQTSDERDPWVEVEYLRGEVDAPSSPATFIVGGEATATGWIDPVEPKPFTLRSWRDPVPGGVNFGREADSEVASLRFRQSLAKDWVLIVGGRWQAAYSKNDSPALRATDAGGQVLLLPGAGTFTGVGDFASSATATPITGNFVSSCFTGFSCPLPTQAAILPGSGLSSFSPAILASSTEDIRVSLSIGRQFRWGTFTAAPYASVGFGYDIFDKKIAGQGNDYRQYVGSPFFITSTRAIESTTNARANAVDLAVGVDVEAEVGSLWGVPVAIVAGVEATSSYLDWEGSITTAWHYTHPSIYFATQPVFASYGFSRDTSAMTYKGVLGIEFAAHDSLRISMLVENVRGGHVPETGFAGTSWSSPAPVAFLESKTGDSSRLGLRLAYRM